MVSVNANKVARSESNNKYYFLISNDGHVLECMVCNVDMHALIFIFLFLQFSPGPEKSPQQRLLNSDHPVIYPDIAHRYIDISYIVYLPPYIPLYILHYTFHYIFCTYKVYLIHLRLYSIFYIVYLGS